MSLQASKGHSNKEDCFHLVFWGLAARAQCVGGFLFLATFKKLFYPPSPAGNSPKFFSKTPSPLRSARQTAVPRFKNVLDRPLAVLVAQGCLDLLVCPFGLLHRAVGMRETA